MLLICLSVCFKRPLSHLLLQVDNLCDGWGKARLKKVTMETVNSGQLAGMLHIEDR